MKLKQPLLTLKQAAALLRLHPCTVVGYVERREQTGRLKGQAKALLEVFK